METKSSVAGAADVVRRLGCRFGARGWTVPVLMGLGVTLATSWGQVPDVQRIPLKKGWNAVHLKVVPADSRPAAVFAGLPVERVATYYPTRSPVEYIQDPGAAPWKSPGWQIWYAPSRPEAVVNDLYAVSAGQAYLVEASTATTWVVQGRAELKRTRWKADSYNFVGFAVDPSAPPTFARWFAGAQAHQSTRRPAAFRLDDDGHWRAVDRPDATLIDANQAYWVFSQGGSEHQGPLEVTVGGGKGGAVDADFGEGLENLRLHFRNRSTVPVRFTVEFEGGTTLPLAYEENLAGSGERVRVGLSSRAVFPALEAGEERELRLVLDRTELAQGSFGALLSVRDDVGGWVRIPVIGRQP